MRGVKWLAVVGVLSVGGCGEVVEPEARGTPDTPTLAVSPVGGPRRASAYSVSVLPRINSCGGSHVLLARGVNSAGTIAGTQASCGGQWAVYWTGGNIAPVELPLYTGVPSDAYDISDDGTMVGERNWSGQQHATLWSGGTPTDLGTIGGTNSLAVAVNNSGVAVGRSYVTASTEWHAFVWQGGVMSDLGKLPNPGPTGHLAYDINNSGVIVGTGSTLADSGRYTPFVYQSGVMSALQGYGEALAINDAGVIVGYIRPSARTTEEHAAMWVNGVLTDLGKLPGAVSGRATGINNLGQVVGYSDLRPFLWENGVMSELPIPTGYVSAWPEDINDGGTIVGRADPNVSAVVWTPLPANTAPTANPGGPYTGAEGALIALDGSASSDPENTPLTYDWDFGDGSPHGTGPTPSHAFPDNGSYTVTLTVSDGALSHSSTTTVTTSNVAPTGVITAPSGASAPQGNVTLTLGNIVEPSSIDAAALQFRFNCGSSWGPIVSSPTTTCALPTTGNRTLRVTIRDKDGAQSNYSKVVNITNVGPTVTILSPTTVTIAAGTAMTFSASFTDPGTADNPWPARVQWGGGLGVQALGNKTPGTPFGASKVYPTPGTFTAVVEVKDTFGAFAQRGTITVIVQ